MERENRRMYMGSAAVCLATMIAFTGFLLGCGGDETATTRTTSMIQTPLVTENNSGGLNSAPTIGEITIRPARPSPGRTVLAIATASDPDGDATQVTYRWKTKSGSLLGQDRTLQTAGLEGGSLVELIAIASDGKAESEPKTMTFRLAYPSAEIGLVVIDTSEGTQPGAQLTAVVETTDENAGPFGGELEWRVNGEVVGTEESLDTERFFPGDVVVVSARIGESGRLARRVSSPAIVFSRGAIPEIVSTPLAGIEAGVFRYLIRAQSPEPDALLTYELVTGPEGMRVDEKSGVVLWSPTTDQRGRFDVEVSVSDQWGSGVAQSFVIIADLPTTSPARAR